MFVNQIFVMGTIPQPCKTKHAALSTGQQNSIEPQFPLKDLCFALDAISLHFSLFSPALFCFVVLCPAVPYPLREYFWYSGVHCIILGHRAPLFVAKDNNDDFLNVIICLQKLLIGNSASQTINGFL